MTQYDVEVLGNRIVIVSLVVALAVVIFPMADCAKRMDDNNNATKLACVKEPACSYNNEHGNVSK